MSDVVNASVVPYILVDSHIRVRGKRVEKSDPYSATNPSVSIEDVQVDVVHRSSSEPGAHRMLRTGAGSQDFTLKLAPDNRLQSIEYNQIGAGAAVVTAGAKLVAFVGSIAATVVGAVAQGGALAGDDDVSVQVEDGDGIPPTSAPHAVWEAANPEIRDLLQDNKTLAAAGSSALVLLRTQLLTSDSAWKSRDLSARVAAASAAVDAARAEISRIESLYLRWRQAQIEATSTTLELVTPVSGLPRRLASAPLAVEPATPSDGTHSAVLRDELRVLLEVIDPRPQQPGVWVPAKESDQDELRYVRWRVPRTVDLLVWTESADGERTLVQRTPIAIADKYSDTHGMQLREGLFGKHGGSWTFGDDGAPSAITTNDESTVKAFSEALASTPETIVGAVDQAKKLTETISGMQDAAAERAQAASERQLVMAKARVELLGVNATAEDAAALARAEQAVQMRTATRSLSPETDRLDDLKQQLDLATTKADLDAKKRQTEVDGELAVMKAEVARLEQEVLAARAAYDVAHPNENRPGG